MNMNNFLNNFQVIPAQLTGSLVLLRAPHTDTPAALLRFQEMFNVAMRELSPGYKPGGFRADFSNLSSGLWFFLPNVQGSLVLKDGVGRPHTMSPEAAGLAGTLYALNRWLWMVSEHPSQGNYADGQRYYQRLQQLAYRHPEAVAIWRVLD